MESKTTEPFVSRQRVHFDMLDCMKMLHNAAYILLFERARTDLWRSHRIRYGDPDFDWPYLVARNVVNYRAPIRSDEEVKVTVAVRRLGRSSITFAHAAYSEAGTLCADGETVLVRIDMDTGQSIPWSDGFRELVAPYMEEGAEAPSS